MSVAPVVVPVFRDLAGCDRAAAAAEAMPKSRLVNAPFVCKVGDGRGEGDAHAWWHVTLFARCARRRAAARESGRHTSTASGTPRGLQSFWRERAGRGARSERRC